LDSFSAMQLCDVLKKVAQQRRERPLHDPPALSSEIFNRFDRLILMNKGRVMYQGPVSSIPDYFEVRGRPCPERYNPADCVMDVAQSVPAETLEAEGFFPPDDRRLTDPFQPDDTPTTSSGSPSGGARGRAGRRARPSWTASSPRDTPPRPACCSPARELVNIRRQVASVGARSGSA
jgi:ABC-2 type transporter